MSEGYKCPLTPILEISPHPNADKLEIATVYGFHVVVQKDKYKIGDVLLYIPIDSIIPIWLEEKLFPVDAKIKLHRSRIRQIKIRKFASQGMLIDPLDVSEGIEKWAKTNKKKTINLEIEQDLSEMLGIVKYEPEIHENTPKSANPRNKPKENPLFHKYGGIENFKWYPELFHEGEEVVIEEKLHGTNARYGMLPNVPNTFWKKVLRFFGRLPEFEFTYGSNNVQLQSKKYTGWYEENLYARIALEYKVEEKLKPGETVYGEIVGPGIQKNYHYGILQGMYNLVIFDVKKYDGEKSYFLSPLEVKAFCTERGFDMVPILFQGPFNKEAAKALSFGDSVYAPSQKVREGCVVKAVNNINESILSKKMLKIVSEDYLSDMSNSDNH